MAETFAGEVRGGAVVFEGSPPPLPEGTKVWIEPVDMKAALGELSAMLMAVAGQSFRAAYRPRRKPGSLLAWHTETNAPSPVITYPMRATLYLPVTRRIKVVRTMEWGNPRRTKQLAAFGSTGHRPPATLPSRSAIARPRLSGRFPLGTLALFPPLRFGRF